MFEFYSLIYYANAVFRKPNNIYFNVEHPTDLLIRIRSNC